MRKCGFQMNTHVPVSLALSPTPRPLSPYVYDVFQFLCKVLLRLRVSWICPALKGEKYILMYRSCTESCDSLLSGVGFFTGIGCQNIQTRWKANMLKHFDEILRWLFLDLKILPLSQLRSSSYLNTDHQS